MSTTTNAHEAQPVAVIAPDEWAAEDIAPTFYYASGAEATMCDHAGAWTNADGNLHCETCGATAYVATAVAEREHTTDCNAFAAASQNVRDFFRDEPSEALRYFPQGGTLDALHAEAEGYVRDGLAACDCKPEVTTFCERASHDWTCTLAHLADPEPTTTTRMVKVDGVVFIDEGDTLTHHVNHELTVRLLQRPKGWGHEVIVYSAPGRVFGTRESERIWQVQDNAVRDLRVYLATWYDLAF